MCNACGNFCCGSDEFGQCGCDHCPEPDCWDAKDHDTDVRARIARAFRDTGVVITATRDFTVYETPRRLRALRRRLAGHRHGAAP